MSAHEVHSVVIEASLRAGLTSDEIVNAMAGLRRADLQRAIRLTTTLEKHTDDLCRFIRACCFPIAGAKTLFADFYQRFAEWPGNTQVWTKRKVAQEFPKQFPVGTYTANKLFIGNLSFTDDVTASAPWCTHTGRLVRSKYRPQLATLVEAVVQLANDHPDGWHGSATDLLTKLTPLLDPNVCPRCPERLSYQLNRATTAFYQLGIEVVQPERRVWFICPVNRSRSRDSSSPNPATSGWQ